MNALYVELDGVRVDIAHDPSTEVNPKIFYSGCPCCDTVMSYTLEEFADAIISKDFMNTYPFCSDRCQIEVNGCGCGGDHGLPYCCDEFESSKKLQLIDKITNGDDATLWRIYDLVFGHDAKVE